MVNVYTLYIQCQYILLTNVYTLSIQMSKTKFSFWLDDGLKEEIIKYTKRDINTNISRIINKSLELYVKDIKEKEINNKPIITRYQTIQEPVKFIAPVIIKKKKN